MKSGMGSMSRVSCKWEVGVRHRSIKWASQKKVLVSILYSSLRVMWLLYDCLTEENCKGCPLVYDLKREIYETKVK
jgi:hypothetical protein